MPTDALAQFLALCAQADVARLQLTQAPVDVDAERLLLRPIVLRGAGHWQAVWRHPRKDLTENWPAAQGPARVAQLLAQGWRSAAIWTSQGHWQLDQSRKGAWRLVKHAVKVSQALTPHNREKSRPLELSHPAWTALGVAENGRDGSPRLVPAMSRKWKQINHFIDIVDAAMRQAGFAELHAPLRVADFGCGRGYLTFALALLLAQQGRSAQVLGVELRDDLVAQTEALARQLSLDGLHFAQGDVGQHEVQSLDMMIALHACDTATDIAIHHGLKAGARVIVCAPCCHKQLRGQLQPPSSLKPLFKHGVHLGQEAEMLTDGLRALLLESQGYDTQVFEFVALEHTQKNKMILAIRRDKLDVARQQECLQQVQELKAFWKLREHHLELLLAHGR
jgi:SAM-dependent methyltransferase